MKVPKRVEERIKTGLRRYKRILNSARSRDINEPDTRLIISDMLSEILGYDKYTEITTEFMIRGTFCDFAIKINDKVHFLIEVKRIGASLKEQYMKQALDYASNEGIDWVILTNGVDWQVYKVLFKKPIEKELVIDLNLLEASPRDPAVVNQLYLLCKEGVRKSAIDEFEASRQATDRFTIAALLQSEPMLKALKREIRKINRAVKIDTDHLRDILRDDIFKRDLTEDEKANIAMARVKRLERRRKKQVKKEKLALEDKEQEESVIE